MSIKLSQFVILSIFLIFLAILVLFSFYVGFQSAKLNTDPIKKLKQHTHNYSVNKSQYTHNNNLQYTISPYQKRIYVSQRIGYLTPNVQFDDFDMVLPLYKQQLDRSGYRFMYYTYVNATTIYLIDKNGKVCNDDDYGCYEFFDKDTTLIFNREYTIHIY